MKKVYLIGCSGVHANAKIHIEDEITIGRDSNLCQLVYPGRERGISSVHCKVRNIDGNVSLTDLNSTNGTFLENGTRLLANVPISLQTGQSFYLADKNNVFVVKSEEIQELNHVSVQPLMQGTKIQSDKVIENIKGNKNVIVFVIVIVIMGVAFSMVNLANKAAQAELERQKAQEALDEELNKSLEERTLEDAQGWLDRILR